MLFNSYIFWAFFGIVVLLYRFLPHKFQNRMLLFASYVFYGWWDWRFLSLILISTLVDYFSAKAIGSSGDAGQKKKYCVLSVIVNLGLLGVFKYYGFFVEQLADLLGSLNIPLSLTSLNIVLPVGISFYTFQTMGYTLDVYRGKTKPERNFLDFALYVAFFPQLVAGPIERSSRLLPQIVNPRTAKKGDFAEGLYLVLTGLFKKIVIADNMGRIVNAVFASDPSTLTGSECWMGVYAFAFQIYGDFAGYSAIARGVAKWLGFDLMVNFRMPYFSRSPREFWRRWHISLSTWLRDYLYIPLGGSRGGKLRTARNVMATMLLGGLWHGAAWTFVAWGFYHGCVLIAGNALGGKKVTAAEQAPARVLTDIARALITFHLVCVGWLVFRAVSFGQAWDMLSRMFLNFQVTDFAVYGLGNILFFVGPLMVLELFQEKTGNLMKLVSMHWLWRGVVYSYFVLMLLWFQPEVTSEFIYFRF